RTSWRNATLLARAWRNATLLARAHYQRVEHGFPSFVAMVVAPRELVQIALQPLVGDLLVVPADAGLEVPEEALDGVRVGVPDDVLARRVTDPVVAGEVSDEAVVRGPLVRVDDRVRFDHFHDRRMEVRP